MNINFRTSFRILLFFFFWLGIITISKSQTAILGKEYNGKASYYHSKFHGLRTASGAKYSNTKYTCAHRSLPFGTMLEVTNKRNGKSVVVKVTDRGPFVKGRLIDLSRVAARQIGIDVHGIGYVHIKVVGVEGEIQSETKTDYKESELPLSVAILSDSTQNDTLNAELIDDQPPIVVIKKKKVVPKKSVKKKKLIAKKPSKPLKKGTKKAVAKKKK